MFIDKFRAAREDPERSLDPLRFYMTSTNGAVNSHAIISLANVEKTQ